MNTSTIQIGKNIISIGGAFKGKIVNNNPNELFCKINVSGFSKSYIPPIIATQVLKQIVANQLIVIGGDYGFDKGNLLRYLAEKLSSSLRTNNDVYEWVGSSDRQNLISALRITDSRIIILQKLQPHHISYDLHELGRVAKRQNLFLLISTDTPKKAWQIKSGLQQNYWLGLDSKNISYDRNLIEIELVKLINDNIHSIRFKNGLTKVDLSSILPGGTLKQLCMNLATPEQVQFFVNCLISQNSLIDVNVIKSCLKQTLSKQDTLMHKWFHSLKPLEQYVAIGMVIFSDLFDDQFFGVARLLSETAWKHSHDGLKALDYKDIEKLFNFFKYDTINREQRYIRNKFPNQRLELLKISWNSHRRHIKMALDVAVRLVIESGERQINTELYGSKRKRRTLRKSIMYLLSDLGRISKNLIEEPLLILASQDTLSSQNVTAGAVANWREIPGGDKQLFELLKDWQQSSRWHLIIDELIKSREKAYSSVAYLRSTIILTIGKAAKYDAPNNLSHELIELLLSFLNDKHKMVRNRLVQIIPDIIRFHASQLNSSIKLSNEDINPIEEILIYEDMIYPTAIGLAMAYIDMPSSTSKTFSSLLLHCDNTPSKIGKKQLNHRDKLMATLILAFGKIIEWNNYKVNIDGRVLYDILVELRDKENNIILKNLIRHIIVEQIILDNNNSDLINILLPKLSANGRNEIVHLLGNHYLEKREKQNGGDRSIKIDEKEYSIWIYNDRPLLKIEELMYEWLKEDSKELRQLATLVFIEFSAIFEHREEEIRQEILKSDQEKSLVKEESINLEKFKPAYVKGRFSLGMLFYNFFIKATLSKEAVKIVESALPVMSRTYLFNQKYKKGVIDKWKKEGGDVKVAAKSLKKLVR